MNRTSPTTSVDDAQRTPNLERPRPNFSNCDSGLSKLSTQAQAGSQPSLTSARPTPSTSNTNLSTVVHTGRPGSPHPVLPLHSAKSSLGVTPPTSSSSSVGGPDFDLTAVGAPDVLTPPAPTGVIPASVSPTTTVFDPVAARERDAAAADADTNSESEDSSKAKLLQRLKEKMVPGGHDHSDD